MRNNAKEIPVCYAKPGPRCSAHAKKHLIEKKIAYLNTGFQDMEARQKVESEYRQAKLDYEATPAGQKYLRIRISQGMDYNGEYAERLQNGIKLRKIQLDAIKSPDEGDMANHEVIMPSYYTEPHPDVTEIRHGWKRHEDISKLEDYRKASFASAQAFTPDEQTAFFWLTSDGGPYLNRVLATKHRIEESEGEWSWKKQEENVVRGEKYSKNFVNEKLRNLNSAFKKHKLEKNVSLYRGLNDWCFPDQVLDYQAEPETVQRYLEQTYPVGEEIKIKEYMSSTVDPGIARKFASFHAPVIMEISTKSAVPVGNMSAWGESEREYMVNKGGHYKVTGIHKEVPFSGIGMNNIENSEGHWVIRLEEVDS